MPQPVLKLEWDTREWHKTAGELMKRTRYKTLPEFLRWRMKICVQDLQKFTPPRGPNPGSESFASMRKRGEKRIRHEVRKLFPDLSAVHVVAHPVPELVRWSKYIHKYIKNRNLPALAKMLRDIDLPVPLILEQATEAAHTGARGSRGRVKAGVRYPVLDGGSVNRLIKDIAGHVGKLKAGWNKAAKYLKAKSVPMWITKHNSPGGVMEDMLSDTPSIQVINSAAATKDMNPNEIVNAALMINERKMETELRKIMEYEFRKANRA